MVATFSCTSVGTDTSSERTAHFALTNGTTLTPDSPNGLLRSLSGSSDNGIGSIVHIYTAVDGTNTYRLQHYTPTATNPTIGIITRGTIVAVVLTDLNSDEANVTTKHDNDSGSGSSVGLAENLSQSTSYTAALRHEASSGVLTTNSYLLGIALTSDDPQQYKNGCIEVTVSGAGDPRISDLNTLVFAMSRGSAAIPTLSERGAMLLFLLLAAAGAVALRRRESAA